MRVPILLILTALTSAQSPAAQSVDSSQMADYVMTLKDQVKPGDYDQLIGSIRERNAFPVNIKLESAGGDVDEAIAIGNFLRTSMLSTTASSQCTGACFLIWVSGVKRNAFGELQIGPGPDLARDDPEVRGYLLAMDVTEASIDVLLADPKSLYTAEQMSGLIEQIAPSYLDWLAEQCGGLTRQEAEDRDAVKALKLVEDSLNSMGMAGSSSMYTISPEIQQKSARAKAFTPEYRDSLLEKEKSVRECQVDAITTSRKALLEQLAGESG
jgi:hypothetical protein